MVPLISNQFVKEMIKLFSPPYVQINSIFIYHCCPCCDMRLIWLLLFTYCSFRLSFLALPLICLVFWSMGACAVALDAPVSTWECPLKDLKLVLIPKRLSLLGRFSFMLVFVIIRLQWFGRMWRSCKFWVSDSGLTLFFCGMCSCSPLLCCWLCWLCWLRTRRRVGVVLTLVATVVDRSLLHSVYSCYRDIVLLPQVNHSMHWIF